MHKPHKWKTISSTKLLTHPRLVVQEDVVEQYDGQQTKYLRFAPSDIFSVTVIASNDQGQLLVQKEYSYPPDQIMWQLPGGSSEIGEDIVEAGLRELAEESGYSARQATVIGKYYVQNRLTDLVQHIVFCTDLVEKKLPPDADEFIETHWIDVETIKNMIKSGQIENINMLAALNIWFQQQS